MKNRFFIALTVICLGVSLLILLRLYLNRLNNLPASTSSSSSSILGADIFNSGQEKGAPTVAAPSFLVSPSSWPITAEEPGLIISKEEGSWKNYLFQVDPEQKNITILNLDGYMEDHWKQATAPLCVINGGFFEPDMSPTFPLIQNGQILDGKKTTKYPARILYIKNRVLSIADISKDSDVLAADWAMSGLRPSYYEGDGTLTNRTIIGIKDNHLFILITQNRTVGKLVELMINDLGIEEKNIIALDSGYSSQIRCFDKDLLTSASKMGSTLIISNP